MTKMNITQLDNTLWKKIITIPLFPSYPNIIITCTNKETRTNHSLLYHNPHQISALKLYFDQI
jgi:hypothetical protein